MSKKPVARRHHYLPQTYLAAFTDTGLKDGRFFVLDVNSGNKFRTSPINVAVKRDFNRVDIEGKSPDAIENALAPFEKQATIAIQNVLDSEEFPNDEDCNCIWNLLCLIAVRNPQLRKSFNRSREQTMHIINDILVSDKKIYEHHVKRAHEAGEISGDDVSFERMKHFVEERKYKIEFSTEGNLRIEFGSFDELLPILGKRMWSILVAPKDGPEFICSDHPVTLFYKNGHGGPVGYELKETRVFFPLGRRIGFYGTFEKPLPQVFNINPDSVGLMNRRVGLSAEHHVYSALPSFFTKHEGQLREVNLKQDQGFNI